MIPEIEDFAAFAATRSDQLRTADKDIAPYVVKAYPDGDWDSVVTAASQLWLDTFEALAEDKSYRIALTDYQDQLLDTLGKTNIPEDGTASVSQVDTVTKYVSTSAVNSATHAATDAMGGHSTRWISMDDDHTRTSHQRADGQVVGLGEKFSVGDAELRYPGDPTGPVEEVINCRCVIAPAAGGRRNIMAAAAAVDDVDLDAEEEIEPTEDDELVDDVVDVPWHAVLAPEEKATGDGRMFGKDALSWRELPLPLLYQHATGAGHEGSVRVGRIDEIWKTEDGEARARGVFNDTPEAQHVINGITDGSIRGTSVDVDNLELDYDRSTDEATDINGGTAVLKSARVAGLTIVAIPAYQEAYIALGGVFEDELSDEEKSTLAACGCGQGLWDADPEEYAISEDDWDGSASGYTDEEWFQATLIHTNGDSRVKSDNKLPIYTPGGALSRAGVHAAAGRLNQTDAPPAAIAAAKTKLRGAYKQLDEDPPEAIVAAAFAAGTHDGPGWLTEPKATARIRRYWTHGKGAGKIRWGAPGDFNRCRRQLAKYVRNPEYLAGTCANMHKEALGIWPGMERGGRHSNLTASVPAVTLVASAVEREASAFADPRLSGPTPITVDGDRIYGHLATWGVCHIGIPGVCTTAPHSTHNYSYFRTGAVHTNGGVVPVGQITMDTGHANLRAGASAAAAHYDNTGSVVADVAAGEDAFGIWVAGALRPGIPDDKRDALAAASLSGDWREIGGSLELVAALAVNVPGFPIPRTSLAASGEEQTVLLAAGVVEREAADTFSADTVAAIARTAVQEYIHQQKQEARVEMARPLREKVRARELAQLRERVGKEA